MTWETKRLSDRPEAMAPDGSEVRILAGTGRGSLAHFTLQPGAVSRAVQHRTVEEVWYVLSGRGRMWRAKEAREEVVDLVPGLSLTIPVGTRFQFRAEGDAPLAVLGTTMPPWPGEEEAIPVEGLWAPTL